MLFSQEARRVKEGRFDVLILLMILGRALKFPDCEFVMKHSAGVCAYLLTIQSSNY